MTDFLTILAFTYLCNSTVELRLVSLDEARDCAAAYEEVKQHFQPGFELASDGVPQQRQKRIAAYLALKQWESENADLVSRLKAEAAWRALNG